MTNRKILVVDDEASITELIQDILKEKYEVSTAQDGQEGLEYALANQDIAVILSDGHMPRKSGFDFIAEYQRQRPDSKTVIVMMGGDWRQNDLDLARELKVYDTIEKPFKIDDLRTFVDNAYQEFERRSLVVKQ